LNLGFSFREFSKIFERPCFARVETMEYPQKVKALVITGGAAPEPERVRAWLVDRPFVVAADSGLETARACGVRASLVVGDFDSLRDPSLLEEYAEHEIRRFGKAKDETDTEIALRMAFEEGADDVALIGGGGGRLDHLFAIASLFARGQHPTAWMTDKATVRCIDGEMTEAGAIGDLVSFFPVGCEPCEMESQGLRWPLDGLRWRLGDAGVSNEFAAAEVWVRMRQGRLVMVRPIGSE
jgi:thiamine pyrophosphokinase